MVAVVRGLRQPDSRVEAVDVYSNVHELLDSTRRTLEGQQTRTARNTELKHRHAVDLEDPGEHGALQDAQTYHGFFAQMASRMRLVNAAPSHACVLSGAISWRPRKSRSRARRAKGRKGRGTIRGFPQN